MNTLMTEKMTNVIQFFNEEINQSHGFKCWDKYSSYTPNKIFVIALKFKLSKSLAYLGRMNQFFHHLILGIFVMFLCEMETHKKSHGDLFK